MKKKIIVIGAGASGMMAAGTAAQRGFSVTVLEKKKREGIKLSITGKGRCNITNTASMEEFMTHFGKNGRFLRDAFHCFFNMETIDFFKEIGVATVKERGGRVFTRSGNAGELVFFLCRWLKMNKVSVFKQEKVNDLIIEKDRVIGVLTEKRKKFFADAVIVATGGKAYPQTGATGDGYYLAKKYGHTIVEPVQSLVPLRIKKEGNEKLKKVKLKNVMVSLFVQGKKKKSVFGEFYFYEKGITGPTVLSLSKKIVNDLKKRKKVYLSLDLKTALDLKKLDKRLIRDLEKFKNREIKNIMRELIPVGMIDFFIRRTGIDSLKKGSEISSRERKKIKENLKNFNIEIDGYGPFEEAIITSGGISIREINPKTMASRKIKNLFFCGEVIDVDADTGGFNLQAAFSTGRCAGLGCLKN